MQLNCFYVISKKKYNVQINIKYHLTKMIILKTFDNFNKTDVELNIVFVILGYLYRILWNKVKLISIIQDFKSL